MIIILKREEAERRLLFCNNLRDLLRNGPIGYAEVAKKTGYSQATIYSYARGKTFPSEERIQKIADALGVTIDVLFDDSNPPWKFGKDEDAVETDDRDDDRETED